MQTRDNEHSRGRAQRRAKGLGWFSIGLGAAALFAPSRVARLIGVRDSERTRHMLQTVGVREVGSGVAILSNPGWSGPVWSRVLGDLMDLGLLSAALKSENSERDRLLAATAAVAGITVIDALSAAQLAQLEMSNGGNGRSLALPGVREQQELRIRLARAITVARPRAEVYTFWKNFENLPRFFEHVESIRIDGSRSRWRARLLGENPLEWEAEVILDRPDESIEWRSFDNGEIASRGAVHFLDAPAGRGTEVRVELEYEPKGVLGAAFGKFLKRLPAEQIGNDLRRFKQLLEVGEVIHSDASIHRGMHPARPSESPALPERTVVS